MADFNSSLPVRTEAAGDIVAKLGDRTTPSQQLAINADGNIGAILRDASNNEKGTVASPLGVQVSDGTDTWAIDNNGNAGVVLKDGSGNNFGSPSNPISVIQTANAPGEVIRDFNTASAVASGSSSNHDYTVTSGFTFYLKQILISASGKFRGEIQIETAPASNTFDTVAVFFGTGATGDNVLWSISEPLEVDEGVRVRIIRTNRDLLAQDLYSTIIGAEVSEIGAEVFEQ